MKNYIQNPGDDLEQPPTLQLARLWESIPAEGEGYQDRNEVVAEILVKDLEEANSLFEERYGIDQEGAPYRVEILPANTQPVRCYVNVYLVDRAYGGPEEGGWWYDYGEVVESRHCETLFEVLAEKKKMQAKYDALNAGLPEISSVNSRGRYGVTLEPRKAAAWPQERPHYE